MFVLYNKKKKIRKAIIITGVKRRMNDWIPSHAPTMELNSLNILKLSPADLLPFEIVGIGKGSWMALGIEWPNSCTVKG